MKTFMEEDFLLSSELAVKLFDKVNDLPIIDYHCHLSSKEIAENKRFKNITEIWLGGDHYKWRFMRSMGVEEKYITGDASDYEKFEKWAEVIQYAIGNPLYHWAHLELKRCFKYEGTLSKKTAKEVWEHCNNIIDGEDFSVFGIFKAFNVEAICTTDDPADSLEHHLAIKQQGIDTKVLPTLRPSNAMMNVGSKDFIEYMSKLSRVSGVQIKSFANLLEALYKRVEFFDSVGCKLSDHALDPPVYEEANSEELEQIFTKALSGQPITQKEIDQYRTAILIELGKKYSELGWTLQLHMGALRSNNTRMCNAIGQDTGYDSMGDESFMYPLSRILDTLDKEDKLPKTILYTLNPAASDAIGTMIGNFQGGGIRGKIQFGSGWWFNDTKTGMQKQMIALGNLGALATFVGMLTDSRSFLSYTRHEYFRRIMVDLISQFVCNGEYPNDMDALEKLVTDISYHNAREYFSF